MKISPFRRFNSDDYPSAASYFSDFLGSLNVIVDALNNLLQNNIDITYNMAAERQTQMMTHGVAQNIKLNTLKQTPSLVRVGYAGGYVATAAITNYNSDGTVQVTVYFQGTAPTTPVSTLLVFEP